MQLLAVALLAHPSGEQLFMLLDRMVRAMGSVPQSQTTMSAMLTMLATSAYSPNKRSEEAFLLAF